MRSDISSHGSSMTTFLGLPTSLEMAVPNAPPNPPAQAELDNHTGLVPEVQTLFRQYEIPYHIWGRLSGSGFTTMQDMADRWTSKESCRESAATDLGFRMGDQTDVGATLFSHNASLKAAIRLAQATEDARVRVAASELPSVRKYVQDAKVAAGLCSFYLAACEQCATRSANYLTASVGSNHGLTERDTMSESARQRLIEREGCLRRQLSAEHVSCDCILCQRKAWAHQMSAAPAVRRSRSRSPKFF